tara:strand:- start:1124 stop:1471 length:348 start_codon:yes stop_codon:yes gene_type:complete
MAQYKIKKQNGQVSIEVTLPPLPENAVQAQAIRDVVREQRARLYLESEGITIYECIQSPGALSNFGSNMCLSGTFIFLTSKKDLTTPPEPVIMKEKPMKRKRVQRDSKTGTETTS